jgi:UDP-N-acetylmuramoyl-L-alanyl-D-glutamate--2,6-diaminopimelate ligase
MTAGSKRLEELARAAGAPLVGGDALVSGISIDSRRVAPGELFVALPGARHDGTTYVADAVARGAVAVLAAREMPGVPTIVAPEPRRALAAVAAAFHDHPARELTMLGITGSLGKTSTALLLEGMLAAAGWPVGVIGSLGIRMDGVARDTGMTTPEAPAIHGALRAMRDAGARAAIMEVTTHAILFDRVTGLEYDLGIITNLVPDEHLEFHPTPEHYVQTKTRFFGMLRPGAPLVHNADDATVRGVTCDLDRPLVGVSLEGSAEADVRVEELAMHGGGSRFTLRVARPLRTIAGGEVPPAAIPLTMRILGPQQAFNAAMAATAALLAGAPAEAIARGLAAAEPMRRRMEIVSAAGPVVIDDTVGNPASIDAVLETVEALPHERLRIVYAIRGARGLAINQHNALALAARVSLRDARLVVTTSEDAADERNRVTDEERDTVLAILRDADIPFDFSPALAPAVERAVRECGPRDLLLLLGAQGMDRGAELARRALDGGARGEGRGARVERVEG